MLISELMKLLAEIQEEEGDLPVKFGVCILNEADLRAENPEPIVVRLLDNHLIMEESAKWSEDLPKVVWL